MSKTSNIGRSLSIALAFTVSFFGTLAPLGHASAQSTMSATPPSPDPRIGLKPGKWDAGEASWNLRLLSATKPPAQFVDGVNSDIAFTGPYAIQGSFNGYQVWNISNPRLPELIDSHFCPESQSDVSVYGHLLFVSSESLTGRIDCGAQGVADTVSAERLRGIRIFDISDIKKPKNVANVQTCRGSHTHTVVVDPTDKANVYVYVSGTSGVRSPSELAGCVKATPDKDPNSALFRIEVIKVPLAHPEQAAIVSSPRIFNDLMTPARHGDAAEDIAANEKEVAAAKANGAFVVVVNGRERVERAGVVTQLLDSIVKARNGTGSPTHADSVTLRANIQSIVDKAVARAFTPGQPGGGPTQCHDITVYPAIGLAGGACAGYGLLLDIHDAAHPRRIAAAADSNFSFWHSATFNNDGTKILFSDEWGGGTQPKCRATDKMEWGADAIFTLKNGQMQFKSYYKMPAPQTSAENCVAHNCSLIPIPGRDVMAQAWYQGGISVFDWTDASHAKEIAYFDRGPIDADKLTLGGSWSVYWYNGVLVSSEIVRGLDIFELTPSALISQNEIDAAKTVHLDYLNAQGQPKLVWPPSFALARAYLDQIERVKGMGGTRIGATRSELARAERAPAAEQKKRLTWLANQINGYSMGSTDGAKIKMLAGAVRDLSATPR